MVTESLEPPAALFSRPSALNTRMVSPQSPATEQAGFSVHLVHDLEMPLCPALPRDDLRYYLSARGFAVHVGSSLAPRIQMTRTTLF
jgi:hypothetical protein